MKQIIPLNEEQIKALPPWEDCDDKRTGRIMCKGKCVNLCSGVLKGGNIIYQLFYWDYPKEWFEQVRADMEENNPTLTFRIAYSK